MIEAAPVSPAPSAAHAGGVVWLRLVAAALVLAMLVGGSVLANQWARRDARVARRLPPKPPLVAIRPAVTKAYAPTLLVARGAALVRLLLGLAILGGVVGHLRRAPRAAILATGAALLLAAFALGTALERGTRITEVAYLAVTVSTWSGRFALHDAYFALALLAGLAAVGLHGPKAPAGGRP